MFKTKNMRSQKVRGLSEKEARTIKVRGKRVIRVKDRERRSIW